MMGDKEQRDALRDYLRQYNNARRRKHDLEHRLREIRAELNNPPLGQRQEPRRGNKAHPASGAASVAFRIDEIEQRIKDQQNDMAKALLNVMDFLDFLPEAGIHRTVMEKRYIDGKGWNAISEQLYLARSGCARIEREAVDNLLTCARVRTVLAREYEGGNDDE